MNEQGNPTDDPGAPATDPSPSASPRAGLIVVGAGPTGLEVVRRTSKITAVTLVDKSFSEQVRALESDGVRLVEGDATSALVLGEAGASQAHSLLAATSEDAANIEACRLAVDFGIPEVICRITDPADLERAMAVGAQPVTGPVAMASALTARLPGVVTTTSEVGMGEGEILQVRVMPGSLVIGRPLAELATREYLVAAIYRRGELVVPHGDTAVEEGDQVLLVGQPDTLRAIADYFRLGAAQFPRQFGYSLVLWDERGDPRTRQEAEWLADVSQIGSCYRLVEPREGGTLHEDDRFRPLALGAPPADPFEPVTDIHPAVYVVEPPRTGLFNNRSLGTLGALLDRTSSPILIARGTTPYRRILVPVTDSPTSWRGLELAVDIARLMDAKITALHVAQPRFLGGDTGDARTEAVVKNIEEIAQLYGLHFEVRVVEGNSISTAAKVAADHQLVVAARRRNQPDSYFRPDVGLRIALAAPCSAVLLSVS
jgi:Trk K+ transport system NAD-binding subunit/nucleotide-binding universal stress UspA family protein